MNRKFHKGRKVKTTQRDDEEQFLHEDDLENSILGKILKSNQDFVEAAENEGEKSEEFIPLPPPPSSKDFQIDEEVARKERRKPPGRKKRRRKKKPPTVTTEKEEEDSDPEYIPPPPSSEPDSDEEENEVYNRKNQRRRRRKKKYSPHWTSSQFPPVKNGAGEYYCGDCSRGNDVNLCRKCKRNCWRWCEGESCDKLGYYNHLHKCFKTKIRRKQKPKWSLDLFPDEKEDEEEEYYCADCDSGNDISQCRSCGRKCWRWCEGDTCKDVKGYKETGHSCFISKRKKLRPRWKGSDFPQSSVGKYYCADCKSMSKHWNCSACGRECWKWCIKCLEYRPYRHHNGCSSENEKKNKKKKKSRKRKREEKEIQKEVEKLKPSRKRRKLDR